MAIYEHILGIMAMCVIFFGMLCIVFGYAACWVSGEQSRMEERFRALMGEDCEND